MHLSYFALALAPPAKLDQTSGIKLLILIRVMCGKSSSQFTLKPIFPCSDFPYLLSHQLSIIMELGPPVPDIPLWEPPAVVTPVTAISTKVVGQVAQSVVEVSSLTFYLFLLVRCTRDVVPTDMLTWF
jgi:hypothetical protein